MALRTEDSSRKMWSLFGLALRTAHALRLHNDEINEELSPFEREMRRRVWHNMRRIDILVSLDRGTYPCLPVNTMVKLPLNLDDSNFDFHTEGPLHAQIGYTCVAMFLSCIDIFSNATNYEFGIIGGKHNLVYCVRISLISLKTRITPRWASCKLHVQPIQIQYKHMQTTQHLSNMPQTAICNTATRTSTYNWSISSYPSSSFYKKSYSPSCPCAVVPPIPATSMMLSFLKL